MASAWERKCHYSHLGKKAVFLPNLLLREEFTDISYPKMLEGVLLLADVSGGLGMAESHGHEPLGRSRPSGALPRDWVAILSLHRPPAVLPKERAAPPGLSAQ